MKMENWFERIPEPEDGRPRLIEVPPAERLAYGLKRYRETWGMSQRQLAEKAGTSQRVISLLEAGKYNASLALLERLAAAMEMRLEVAFRTRGR